MKKSVLFLFLLAISFSFVLAAPGQKVIPLSPSTYAGTNDSVNGTNGDAQIQIMARQGMGEERFENMTPEQRRARLEAGQDLRVQIMEQNRAQMREIHLERIQNRLIIRAGNYSVNCTGECEFNESGERAMINKRLSNGRNAYVKVMPDTASEVALERLRLHVCNKSNNCTLELKEVSARSNASSNATLAYELRRERKAKVLGFIGARMDVKAQVDAETGEVIRVRKPWWAFLASEPEEEVQKE